MTPASRDRLRPGRALLTTGVVGSLAVLLCCVTPALVVLLGALGLSAWLGWLDYVLIPALVGFVGIAVFALRKRKRACRS